MAEQKPLDWKRLEHQQYKVMEWQKKFNQLELLAYRFACSRCGLYQHSPDFLRIVSHTKSELKQLIEFIRQWLGHWPIECGCYGHLQPYLCSAYDTMQTLFTSYPFAYRVEPHIQDKAGVAFKRFCFKADWIYGIMMNMFQQCSASHCFMHVSHAQRPPCGVCHRQHVSFSP